MLISKYRAAIMGFSILWIMFFHSKIDIPDAWYFWPVDTLKSAGYAGVEMFFLLSGVGLAFSFEKGTPLLAFYKKRLLKIVPIFLFFSCVMFAIVYHNKDYSLFRLIGKITGLDLFLAGSGSFFWFIPALLMFYAVSPLAYRAVKSCTTHAWVSFAALYMLLLGVVIAFFPQNLVWYVRLPVFIGGLFIGHQIYRGDLSKTLENPVLNLVWLLISMVFLVLIFQYTTENFRSRTGFWWYPTVVMAYPVTFCLAHLIDRLKNHVSVLAGALAFIGGYTLELYLTHCVVYTLPDFHSFSDYPLNFWRVPEYLLYAIISLALSVLIQRITRIYT
ncbi:acyltransferase [Teredinibacter turnerae]|uniref:acyltransferase family protein n=1 Tax=Teredinibacter turnerae TaxID=2426 RepID=UPI00035F289D|nr:acyltransferase [Teredinibacter turnerae]